MEADTAEQLEPLYKSKYLLCDTDNQFKNIKNKLDQGYEVLYCSTPCQCSALKLYLGKDYDKLFIIDFVCHGVGSQNLFDESIKYLEEKEKITISNFVFRSKNRKAASHYYNYYYLKDNKLNKKGDLYFSFPYYNAYCKQLACRNSCYYCKYASRERVGDITIGDFHSIEKYIPAIDRFAGVSMILVNTEKGCELFNLIKNSLYFKSMDSDILYKNNRFDNNVSIPKKQSAFMKSVKEDSFNKTVKKFLTARGDFIKIIYYKLPSCLRKIIKKIAGV